MIKSVNFMAYEFSLNKNIQNKLKMTMSYRGSQASRVKTRPLSTVTTTLATTLSTHLVMCQKPRPLGDSLDWETEAGWEAPSQGKGYNYRAHQKGPWPTGQHQQIKAESPVQGPKGC